MKKINILIFSTLILYSFFATAQKNSTQVLDFEGEVIEGERKKADLFLQISADQIKFDSVLYLRENFNDYLEVDRKSRNRFFKTK